MAKIIYIESSDLITSVVDKLISERVKNIFLVIPSNAIFWRDTINLKLLKREMANLTKSIIIINPDRSKRDVAERAGFKAMAELPQRTSEDARPEEYKIEESLESMLLAGRGENGAVSDSKPKRVSDIIRRSAKNEAKKKKVKLVMAEKPKPIIEESFEDFDEEMDGFVDEDIKDENEPSLNINFYKKLEDEEKRELEDGFFNRRSFEERLEDSADHKKSEQIEDAEINKRDFWKKLKDNAPRSSSIFITTVSTIAIFVAAGIAFVILPQAQLYISRKVDAVSFDVNINVNTGITSVDFNNNEIPGQILKVTKGREKNFLATGERDIEEKAGGVITIYNELDSTPQSMIPSRFQDKKSGKIFWSAKSIIVPGAVIKDGQILPGTVEVEIVASEAGNGFNMDCSKNSPCDFTIPAWKGTVKYDKLYAKAYSPIDGGSVGKVKVVTLENVNNAKQEINSILENELKNAFMEKVPGDLKLLEESLSKEVVKRESTAQAGDVADNFTYGITMELSGFVFNESDLDQLINYNLAGKITEDKELIGGGQKNNFEISHKDNGDLIIRAYGNGEVVSRIDQESIRNGVLGKDETELRKYFNGVEGIESVKVNFWPFWVSKAPNKIEKIDIIIEK